MPKLHYKHEQEFGWKCTGLLYQLAQFSPILADISTHTVPSSLLCKKKIFREGNIYTLKNIQTNNVNSLRSVAHIKMHLWLVESSAISTKHPLPWDSSFENQCANPSLKLWYMCQLILSKLIHVFRYNFEKNLTICKAISTFIRLSKRLKNSFFVKRLCCLFDTIRVMNKHC